uniref:ABC transporter permease n=1 Tax=Eiseniibacteriota bacterium TaxID=2212470 RepID=A0A832I8F0_UNCEI
MLRDLERLMTSLERARAVPGGAPGAGSAGGTPAADGAGFSGPAIRRVAVAAAREGPRSGWEVTFPSAMLWALIAVCSTFAVSIVAERRQGTYLRLRLTPVSREQVLAGKGLACFLAGTGVLGALLAVGVALFRVRVGDAAMLAAAVLCTTLCFVGVMMFVATLGRGALRVRRELGAAAHSVHARRRHDPAHRHAALAPGGEPPERRALGHPLDRGRGVARLRLGRGRAVARHPPRRRHGGLRDRLGLAAPRRVSRGPEPSPHAPHGRRAPGGFRPVGAPAARPGSPGAVRSDTYPRTPFGKRVHPYTQRRSCGRTHPHGPRAPLLLEAEAPPAPHAAGVAPRWCGSVP